MWTKQPWIKAFEDATNTYYDVMKSEYWDMHIFVHRVNRSTYEIPYGREQEVFEQIKWRKPKVRATRRMSKKGK